jgi:hypothetical protein
MNQVERREMKQVLAMTERGGKTYWSRIGIAFVNRDGSITAKLDAVPVSGQLQIREWDQPREYPDRKPQDAPPASPPPPRRDPVDSLF